MAASSVYHRIMARVEIPADQIVDWPSFHDVFAKALSFPAYYGRNGDAFIDCMWDIARGQDVPQRLGEDENLTIDLGQVDKLRDRCPDQLAGLLEMVAFVNARNVDDDLPARIAVAFR